MNKPVGFDENCGDRTTSSRYWPGCGIHALNDLIFRNGLKLAIGNNVGVREDCLTLYADVEKLIGFINEELDEQL